MRLSITILVLILCFSSCKKKTKQKSESKKEKTELKVKPTEKIDLTKVPDSLELIADKKLIGDFNGDNKTDFASVVKNTKNEKIGVLIIHSTFGVFVII